MRLIQKLLLPEQIWIIGVVLQKQVQRVRDPSAHFCRRVFGKGHDQQAVDIRLLFRPGYEPYHSFDQHGGFPGASRRNKHRAVC